jgi:hypothetical protein
MTTIRVSAIHLIRTKKLKSGVVIVRHRKTITDAKTTTVKVGDQLKLTAVFDNKWAVGSMSGTLDITTGNFSATVDSCELRGYLRGRGFKPLGYGLSANNTNIRRRG